MSICSFTLRHQEPISGEVRGGSAGCGCSRRSPSPQEGRGDSAEHQEWTGWVPVSVDLGSPSTGNGPLPSDVIHLNYPLVTSCKQKKDMHVEKTELIPGKVTQEKESKPAAPLQNWDTKSQYWLLWIQKGWFYFKKCIFFFQSMWWNKYFLRPFLTSPALDKLSQSQLHRYPIQCYWVNALSSWKLKIITLFGCLGTNFLFSLFFFF